MSVLTVQLFAPILRTSPSSARRFTLNLRAGVVFMSSRASVVTTSGHMASILPENDIDQIDFCSQHTLVWGALPSTLGLTPVQVAQLSSLADAARASHSAALAARAASLAATTRYRADIAAMRAKAAELLGVIKAHAALQSEPASVYSSAELPLARDPRPLALPGVPTSIAVTLESSGAVTLSWNSANSAASRGAFFTVSRRLPGEKFFTVVGAAPGSTSRTRRPSFTDDTVPAGIQGAVAYTVTPVRGPRSGEPSLAVAVQLGGARSRAGAAGTGTQIAA